jgi:hypothetical protein
MDEKRFCVGWGYRRSSVEAYLYGGNEIVAEYERDHTSSPYLALIECQATGGFGPEAQSARLASGTAGSQARTLLEAEQLIDDLQGRLVSWRLHGESPRAGDGPRLRPSGLART